MIGVLHRERGRGVGRGGTETEREQEREVKTEIKSVTVAGGQWRAGISLHTTTETAQ